jgi:hypothetical protein
MKAAQKKPPRRTILDRLAVPKGRPATGFFFLSVSDRRIYPEGEAVILAAALKDGSKPIPNSKIKAELSATSIADYVRFDLADDGRPPDALPGDGIFMGRVPRRLPPGEYKFFLTASGPVVNGLPAFSKVVTGHFSVAGAP